MQGDAELNDDLSLENVGNEEDDKKTEEEKKTEEINKEKDKEEEEGAPGELEDNKEASEEKADDEQLKQVAQANYKLLVEQGVLPEGLEINSFGDLKNQIEDLKLAGITEVMDEMPDDLKSSVEAWRKGLDYRQATQRKTEILSYDKITDDDLKEKETALRLIREYHELMGDDAEYIKSRLDMAVDTDTFVVEAKRARKHLLNVKKSQDQAKEQQELAELKRKEDAYNNYRTGMEKSIRDSEVFWGRKLSKVEQQNLVDAIFAPDTLKKRKTDFIPLEQALNNDPSLLAQINYLYISGMLGKDGNLNILKNAAKSKATDELTKILRTNTTGTGTENNSRNLDDFEGMSIISDMQQALKGR